MRCSVYSLWLAVLLPAGAATTPVFQFNESWLEQVKAVREECDTPPCPVFYDLVANNSASFKVTVPWAGIDPNSFDEGTQFSLRLGDWQFQRALGEAGNFQPGVSNVTFIETGEDSAGRAITLSRVYVKWTASSLVVTGYDKALIPSIAAGNHLETSGAIREWLPGEMTLGNFGYTRRLFTTGTTTLRSVTAGTGADQQQYTAATVIVAGSADYTKPLARIAYPLTGLRWFSNNIAMRGTASDNSGVTAVMVKVNNGEFQTATGTNAWTNIVALTPGTNVIQVKALDADANESVIASTRVIFVVTNSLALAINPPGSGRVTGVANGQILEVGRRYSATATPIGITNLFAGWTGDWPSSNAALSFFMQSNMTMTANFAPNPFLARVATYRGLFMPEFGGDLSRTNAGSVVVTLGSKGTFSGSVNRANGSHTFTGTFDLNGAATVLAKRLGSAPLIVSLQIDVLGSGGIIGSVSDGVWVSPLRAERIPAVGLAGRYNFSLPGAAAPSTAPTNTSTGAITVATGGTFTGALALADTTRVTLAGSLTRTGEWPIFLPLYSGTGLMVGWVNFSTNVPPFTMDSTNVHWLRPPQTTSKTYPAGFHLLTWLNGERTNTSMLKSATAAATTVGAGTTVVIGNAPIVAPPIAAPPVVPPRQPSVVYEAGSSTRIGGDGLVIGVNGPDPWRWFISVNFMDCEPSGILSPGGSMIGTHW